MSRAVRTRSRGHHNGIRCGDRVKRWCGVVAGANNYSVILYKVPLPKVPVGVARELTTKKAPNIWLKKQTTYVHVVDTMKRNSPASRRPHTSNPSFWVYTHARFGASESMGVDAGSDQIPTDTERKPWWNPKKKGNRKLVFYIRYNNVWSCSILWKNRPARVTKGAFSLLCFFF